MLAHTTEIRVRYADTDQMGHVYYGKYLEYFEVGRTDLLRSLDFPYRKLEDAGFMLPVLDAYVKYVNRALYDDLLLVEARMNELPQLRMKLEYTITNSANGTVIAEGYTTHIFVNSGTMKVVRVPDVFTNLVRDYFAAERK